MRNLKVFEVEHVAGGDTGCVAAAAGVGGAIAGVGGPVAGAVGAIVGVILAAGCDDNSGSVGQIADIQGA